MSETTTRRALSVILVVALGLLNVGPAHADDKTSLKGDEKRIGDLKGSPINLDAKLALPCLVWADDKGTAFFTLDSNGVLRKVSFPAFEVSAKKDFGRKCAWLARSAEGLVVTVPDRNEVWLVDPEKLEVVRKIEVANLRRAAAAPGSSVGAAVSQGRLGQSDLFALDFKTGKATKFDLPKDHDPKQKVGFDRPVMSPDGQYLFTEGYEQITRFKRSGGTFKFEEATERLGQGGGGGIVVSADSKFVCLPSGGNPVTSVFPVADFTKRECTLETGPYPAAVGFDPVAERAYSHNVQHSLMVFTLGGIKKSEYKVGGDGLGVMQFLVHPGGNKLILLTRDSCYSVEMPSKE